MKARLIVSLAALLGASATAAHADPYTGTTVISSPMTSWNACPSVPVWPGYGAVPYQAYLDYWRVNGFGNSGYSGYSPTSGAGAFFWPDGSGATQYGGYRYGGGAGYGGYGAYGGYGGLGGYGAYGYGANGYGGFGGYGPYGYGGYW